MEGRGPLDLEGAVNVGLDVVLIVYPMSGIKG